MIILEFGFGLDLSCCMHTRVLIEAGILIKVAFTHTHLVLATCTCTCMYMYVLILFYMWMYNSIAALAKFDGLSCICSLHKVNTPHTL